MIVMPFQIPPGLIAPRRRRTAQPQPDRRPAGRPADALPDGGPGGRASPVPLQPARAAPPGSASGWAPPAVELVVAGVRGHDGLLVSGFSDGPLTLYRRGNDGTPPRALASFAADLDGSFYDAADKFLGRMVADQTALFHPDWLQTIDVAGGRPGQDRPSAPLIQVQEEEEEERLGHLPGEHIPGQPRILSPLPSPPLTPEEMERHEGAPVPSPLPSTVGLPGGPAAPKGGSSHAVLELLMPGGKLVGVHQKGADENTTTVSRQQFNQIVAKLMTMRPEKVDRPTYYKGQWYRLPDGSEFGLRESTEHGLTLDTPGPENGNLKVHQK